MAASNSTGKISNPFSWVRENANFFFMRIKGLNNKQAEIISILDQIDTYIENYHQLTGRDLRSARILEVGYGARPLRLMALQSLGFEAIGIDLDRPILGSFRDFLELFRKNGARRMLKSAVRALLFDRHERRTLDGVLKARGSRLKIDPTRFLVGDAAVYPFEPASVDFIFSEDVFEHINRREIPLLCSKLAEVLRDNGVAFITPSVFTGISGGHLVEWYPHTLRRPLNRHSEPWEHLRKRRVTADCYLNELRLKEYEECFSKHFHIVRTISHDNGRGREFLLPAIREELSNFTDDELLCDRVTFVLRQRGNGRE